MSYFGLISFHLVTLGCLRFQHFRYELLTSSKFLFLHTHTCIYSHTQKHFNKTFYMRKLPSFEFNNSPDDVNDKTLWMKMILPSNTHARLILKKRIKPKNPIREFIF